MDYRTILVHADLSVHARARVTLAARLAHAHRAHLVGAAMTGISRFTYPGAADLGRTIIGSYVDTLYEQATQALAQFEQVAAAAGAGSIETRLVADDHQGGLVQLARFCDLLVLGQIDPQSSAPDPLGDLPERVMLNAARPVLLAPYADVATDIVGTAVIGWDGSRESAHAVAAALPLLHQASRVVIVHFQEEEAVERDVQAAELVPWLARHGLHADLVERPGGRDIGARMLSLATELQATLIVIGGFGHPRFRELLLGGVTKSLFRNTTVPLLVAH